MCSEFNFHCRQLMIWGFQCLTTHEWFTVNAALHKLYMHLLWVWVAYTCIWEWNMHSPFHQICNEKRINPVTKIITLSENFEKQLLQFFLKDLIHFPLSCRPSYTL